MEKLVNQGSETRTQKNRRIMNNAWDKSSLKQSGGKIIHRVGKEGKDGSVNVIRYI